jgi:agmatinase
MTTDPSENPVFQNPGMGNGSTEANRALERENHLPLTGWQQEVDQGLTYGSGGGR